MFSGAGTEPSNHLVDIFQSVDILGCGHVTWSYCLFKIFSLSLHCVPAKHLLAYIFQCHVHTLFVLLRILPNSAIVLLDSELFCCICVFQCSANCLKIKLRLPFSMEVVSRFDRMQFRNGVKEQFQGVAIEKTGISSFTLFPSASLQITLIFIFDFSFRLRVRTGWISAPFVILTSSLFRSYECHYQPFSAFAIRCSSIVY